MDNVNLFLIDIKTNKKYKIQENEIELGNCCILEVTIRKYNKTLSSYYFIVPKPLCTKNTIIIVIYFLITLILSLLLSCLLACD